VTKLFNKFSSLRSHVWRVVMRSWLQAIRCDVPEFIIVTRLLRRNIAFVDYLYSGEVGLS